MTNVETSVLLYDIPSCYLSRTLIQDSWHAVVPPRPYRFLPLPSTSARCAASRAAASCASPNAGVLPPKCGILTVWNVPLGNVRVELARAVRAGHSEVHLVLGRRWHLGDVDALLFRLDDLAVVF